MQISGILSILEKSINVVISLLLMLMTAAIFYQVVLRYGFSGANIWAEEFARYAFIWVVMLGSASSVRRFKHIRIDFLVEKFPPTLRRVVEFATYVGISIFLVVLIIYGTRIAQQTGNQISAGLGIPMSWMYLSIPVGGVLMLVFTLEILFRDYLSGLCQRRGQ